MLVNPWVRTPQGEAKTQLKHYYLSRLINPDLWRKLFRGKFEFGDACKDILGAILKLKTPDSEKKLPLPDKMRSSLEKFQGDILLILSGNDLVAREFEDVVKASWQWRNLLNTPKMTRHELPGADHTFSCRLWQDQVAQWTCEWISKI